MNKLLEEVDIFQVKLQADTSKPKECYQDSKLPWQQRRNAYKQLLIKALQENKMFYFMTLYAHNIFEYVLPIYTVTEYGTLEQWLLVYWYYLDRFVHSSTTRKDLYLNYTDILELANNNLDTRVKMLLLELGVFVVNNELLRAEDLGGSPYQNTSNLVHTKLHKILDKYANL